MPLSDVLDMPVQDLSGPAAPDLSNIDAMSGDYITPPAPPPTLGAPANNSADQAEQARLQNNAGAIRTFGPNAPQQPPPAPVAPPAPPRPAGPPPGVAAPQGQGVPGGVGAYGAGAAGQPGGQIDPIVAAAMAQNGAAPGRPAGFVPQSRTAETSPMDPRAEQSLQDLQQAKIDQARMQQRYNVAAGEALAPLQQRQATEQQKLLADTHASLQEHVEKIQQLTDNASKAAHEEPEDFWGGKDIGKHITRTLGMALMAFGHGLNPNAPNPMEYMNAMIKQSADKQKAKVDAAKGDLDRETNLYAMMKQKFGDDQSAMAATQAMQKQAVLDQIDAHFAPPAKKTWGGQEEQEDPFASLPPTAALGLANSRLALAQSIADDWHEVDKTHVSKLQTSEHYQQAVAGGGGTIAQRLHTGAQAAEDLAKIRTAEPGAQAGVRKAEAEAGVEEGKAAASTGGGPELKKFEQAAKEIHSVGIWTNPGETISQHFQGTEGQEHRLAIDTYNAMISAKFNDTHRGLARSNKELFDRGLHAFEINPDTDTPITIQRKLNQAREKLFTGAPAEGGAGGTVDTAGEGEQFE